MAAERLGALADCPVACSCPIVKMANANKPDINLPLESDADSMVVFPYLRRKRCTHKLRKCLDFY